MEVDSRQERDERLVIFKKEPIFTLHLDPNKENSHGAEQRHTTCGPCHFDNVLHFDTCTIF